MAGSIEFTPPYQDGWQDNEEGATPITADILNNNYDAFLLLLNTWIENTETSLVAIPDSLTDLSGDVQISSPSNGQVLKFNGSKWVNAAESGGGSNVSWNQILQSGTQIASITINGLSYTVYAPTPVTNLNGLSDVTLVNPSNNQVLQYNSSISKWENKSISVGDTVSFTQIQSSGVKIGTITIDGTDYDIYAPQGGGGSYEPNGVTYTVVNNATDDTQSGQAARSIVVNKFEDNIQTDTGSLSYSTVVTTGPNNFTVGNVKSTYTLVSGTAYWVLTVISGHIQYNGTLYEAGDEILRTPVSGSSVITLTDIEEMEESHSTVVWTQTQQSGTKIAEISIDGVSQNVYIPTPPTKTSDLTNDSNFVADASYVHTDNNYTTTEKNKLADLNQVEANPSSGTSAGNLNSIEIGGTKYDIPSGGGGGTTVIANPSGEATDELEKLQVGNTIYSIPSGGSGGGSGFSKTTLYTGTSFPAENTSIQLLNSIDSYDYIEFDTGHNTQHFNYTFTPAQLKDVNTNGCWMFTDNGYACLKANSNGDEISFFDYSGWTNKTLLGIYGLKFEGGGGSGSAIGKNDILWEYSDSYNITLAHPFTDYDFLVFEGNNYSDANHKGGAIVSSTELDSIIGVSRKIYTFNGAVGIFANYTVGSTTSLTYVEGEARVLRVWGIKLGGAYKEVTGTLTAGQTSITLSDSSITTNSTIEVFNDLDIPYNSKTLTTGSITLAFDAQSNNMVVKVRVS